MKKLIVLAAVAALALSGIATAAPLDRGHGKAGLKIEAGHTIGHVSVLAGASAYLGLDRDAIVAQLKTGKSLAEIAVAQGKTEAGLVAALLAPAKLKLDAQVAAGRLTADREATVLAKLQAQLTKAVERKVTPKTPREAKIRLGAGEILQPMLAYLGLDMKALVAQVMTGKTLAEVAVAQGKTAQGLVDAIVASVKAKLDVRVAAGKLSAASEATFLTQLQTSVQAFVTGSHS